MRSDHWNFLANLLGTPGPAEPRKAKDAAESKPPAAEAKSPPREDSAADTNLSHAKNDRGNDVDPESMPDSPDSVDEVLEALTSVVAPPTLPGFGPAHRAKDAALEDLTSKRSARDVADPRDSKSNRPARESSPPTSVAKEPVVQEPSPIDDPLDQAWGALAGELGITPAAPPRRTMDKQDEPAQPLQRDPLPPNRPSADASKPPKKHSGGGFGVGLGIDDELDEMDDELDVVDDELDVIDDGDFDRPSAVADTQSSARPARRDSESRDRGSRDRGPGGSRDRSAKSDDFDDDIFSSRHLFAEVGDDDVDDDDEDDDAPVMKDRRPNVESSPRDKDRDVRNRDEERGRGRRPPRGRGREDHRPKDEGRAVVPAARSVGDNADDMDDDIDFLSTEREPTSVESDESAPARTRRGRRGSRQRGGQSGAARAESNLPRKEVPDSNVDPKSVDRGGRGARGARPQDERPATRHARTEPVHDSEFAADLMEDDLVDSDLDTEVRSDRTSSDDEDAPRPRRRRRRGRGGRGSRENRDANAPRDESEKPRDEIPVSAFDDDFVDRDDVGEVRQSRSRPRDGESREEPRGRSSRDRADRADRGPDLTDAEKQRHGEVPTWLETVDILVNANVENHKRSGRGGGGAGGGGRGRGGKRRS